MNQITVIFTTLAMNQTVFFETVGRLLKKQGYQVAYICFHERSYEYLRGRGEYSLNAFETNENGLETVCYEDYGCRSLNLLLSHEKAAFETTSTKKIADKFRRYLHTVSEMLDRLGQEESRRFYMVQELGGFTSLLAAFHAARQRNIDNLFIEPAFFRGRVFFLKNSFSAPSIPGPSSQVTSAVVNEYVDETIRKQSVVIPVKDAHHYRAAVHKIVDRHNARRFLEKFIDKYVLTKREEFNHIGGHVERHIRMAVNSHRLRRFYRQLPGDSQFVYYPLHVPADVALTLRSPEFLDQYSLIDFLCRAVPLNYKVAIKEHPALVGAVDYRRMRDLLEKNDNLILLDARINNYQVLGAARAVVTVNSKSGAEALLLGKQVVVLGDAFYRRCKLVHAVDSLSQLPTLLEKIVKNPPNIDQRSIRNYFQDVWNASYPGELYDASAENVQCFSDSLCRALSN